MSAPVARTHPVDAAALGALGFLTLVWGYNWVVMKIALAYAAPFTFAASRTLGGGLCLLSVLWLSRRPFWPRHPGQTLLLGLLQTTLFMGFTTWSLVHGGAAKSAVLVYAMPFWLVLLAPAVLGERMRGLQPLAVGLAFIGLVLIFEPWRRASDFGSSLLALSASLAWAVSVLVAKKIPVHGHWDLLSLTAWQMVLGALPLVGLAALLPGRPLDWSPAYVAALVYNILPGNALAWFLWLYIVGRLPATLSGLTSLAVPLVGALSGWLQLGERPGRVESLGMLLVLAALALLAFTARPRIGAR